MVITTQVESELVAKNNLTLFDCSPKPSSVTLLQTEAMVRECRWGSIRNGCHDSNYSLARRLVMVLIHLEVRSEVAAWEWKGDNESVGAMRECRIMQRSSQLLLVSILRVVVLVSIDLTKKNNRNTRFHRRRQKPRLPITKRSGYRRSPAVDKAPRSEVCVIGEKYSTRTLNILQLNINGAQKKTHELSYILKKYNLDIACLQEAELNPNLKQAIK
ncbi:hypothetical protein TNCV_4619061 [Trichonephila clavipes]|nr:hypothetical protein TNCV_4619061 [Trichonephila clavipes]